MNVSYNADVNKDALQLIDSMQELIRTFEGDYYGYKIDYIKVNRLLVLGGEDIPQIRIDFKFVPHVNIYTSE